jgi:very-short-patch-repair endonuclease
MTDAERKLWWHLRQLPIEGTHFRRQATIGPYFVDFACHQKKLVIEVDGSQHATPRRAAADAARTAFLTASGYRVLRFWNNEVLKETRAVMEAIYQAVCDLESQRPPPLTPPHRAEEARGEGNPEAEYCQQTSGTAICVERAKAKP